MLSRSRERAAGLVLGCGSNVVDLFYRVRSLPAPGEKQYFADERILSDAIVGGVTLNHLSWAALMGAPTGLMALQGTDPHGVAIRTKLRDLGVSTDGVRVSGEYTTSVSHVFIDEEGERSILMAPASTSTISGDVVDRLFAPYVESNAAMVTTEISQVPLSGVEALLASAVRRGVPSLLDVDVKPSVATGAARLGDVNALRRCIGAADVVKLTRSAAADVLRLGNPSAVPSASLAELTQQIQRAFGLSLCVITDGSRGSALAARSGAVTEVPAIPNVVQVDATGAGDAFFGGMVASCHAWGLPTSVSDLERVGRVSSAAGAACCGVLGALPVPEVSLPALREYEPLVDELLSLRTSSSSASGANSSASSNSAAAAAAATSAASATLQQRQQQQASASSAAGATPAASSAAATTHEQASLGAAVDAAALQSQAPQAGKPARKGTHAILAIFDSLHADVETAIAVFRTYHRDLDSGEGRFALALRRLAQVICLGDRDGMQGANTVWCTGMGKSGVVAARLATSLRSVGARASYVHAVEWAHGDLGALRPGDVVIAVSYSGATEELVRLAAELHERDVALWSIVGRSGSALEQVSDGVVLAPSGDELLGLVPTRSVVAQEIVVNALVTLVAAQSGTSDASFRRDHPGGAIGTNDSGTAEGNANDKP